MWKVITNFHMYNLFQIMELLSKKRNYILFEFRSYIKVNIMKFANNFFIELN
jgi:hypothetical protein